MGSAGVVRMAVPAWPGSRARLPVAAAAIILPATVLAVYLAGTRSGPADDRPAQVALLAVIVGSIPAARWVPVIAGACCLSAYTAYGWRDYDAVVGVELPIVLALFVVGLRGGRRTLVWLAAPTVLVGAVRGAWMAPGSPAEQLAAPRRRSWPAG